MILSFLSMWTNLLYDGLLRLQILFMWLLISDKFPKKRLKEKQKKVKKGKYEINMWQIVLFICTIKVL